MNAAETGSALTRQLLAFSCKQVMIPKVIDLGEITAGLGKMIPRVLGEDIDVVSFTAKAYGTLRPTRAKSSRSS